MKKLYFKLKLVQVLPQRIQEWNMTQSVADEHNRKQLEKIRRQQMEARNKLKQLDLKHQVKMKYLKYWESAIKNCFILGFGPVFGKSELGGTRP